MVKTILIVCSFFLALLIFIHPFKIDDDKFNGIEIYDPSLSYLNSIDKLQLYTDSIALRSNIGFNTPGYAILAEHILTKRFYHGFSHFTADQNWIAVLAEKVTGIGIATLIQPEAIMQHPNAACSQQAIVLMELLRNKKTSYRNLCFPHHYALEAKYGNDWFYLDPDMEPTMTDSQRMHSFWKGENDFLKTVYTNEQKEFLDFRFGNSLQTIAGDVNAVPAPHLKIFQRVTKILCYTAWIFPLLILWLIKRKQDLISK